MIILILSLMSPLLYADTAEFFLKRHLQFLNKPAPVNGQLKMQCLSETPSTTILSFPRSTDEIIEKMEEIEQVCTHGEVDQNKQMLETISAFQKLYQLKNKELKKYKLKTLEQYTYDQLGRIKNDQQSNKALNATIISEAELSQILKEQNEFNDKNPSKMTFYTGKSKEDLNQLVQNNYPQKENPFYQLPNDKRCEFLKLAYINAVYELTLLSPSKDYNGTMDDLLVSIKPEVVEFKNYEIDKIRAAWALRNFLSLQKEDIPANCITKAGRSIYQEAMLRFNSIVILPAQKKPLGFALGMCGRSMTGHAFDVEEPMRKETDICFSEVHQKALLEGRILQTNQ